MFETENGFEEHMGADMPMQGQATFARVFENGSGFEEHMDADAEAMTDGRALGGLRPKANGSAGRFPSPDHSQRPS